MKIHRGFKDKESRAWESRAMTVIYHLLLVLSLTSKRKDTYKWDLKMLKTIH